MPAPTRLSMDLRDGRRGAINRVKRALTAGSLDAAAEKLGLTKTTLWRWSQWGGDRCIPAVAKLVDESGLRAEKSTE